MALFGWGRRGKESAPATPTPAPKEVEPALPNNEVMLSDVYKDAGMEVVSEELPSPQKQEPYILSTPEGLDDKQAYAYESVKPLIQQVHNTEEWLNLMKGAQAYYLMSDIKPEKAQERFVYWEKEKIPGLREQYKRQNAVAKRYEELVGKDRSALKGDPGRFVRGIHEEGAMSIYMNVDGAFGKDNGIPYLEKNTRFVMENYRRRLKKGFGEYDVDNYWMPLGGKEHAGLRDREGRENQGTLGRIRDEELVVKAPVDLIEAAQKSFTESEESAWVTKAEGSEREARLKHLVRAKGISAYVQGLIMAAAEQGDTATLKAGLTFLKDTMKAAPFEKVTKFVYKRMQEGKK